MTESCDHGLGIYISVPFCRAKCTYCNFASGVYAASEHGRYVDRLIEDLTGARAWAESVGAVLPRYVDTVYLGGGTPSLLAPDLLIRLFACLRSEFNLEADAEITMECAPGQLGDATLDAMTDFGVTRASLGAQSFVDSEARASGRLHSRAAIEADLHRLRAAGIGNLNVDLLAGLAGQTAASWEESLLALIDSGVSHASIYMLEVDEESRLGREILRGGSRYHAAQVPGDDAIARMYERAIELLEDAGLYQYEISNFARPGCQSRHNARYWQRRPYLGVGLDASSMLWSEPTLTAKATTSRGRRFGDHVLRTTTTDDLKAFLARAANIETEWLDAARQHEEAWFLGLRMNVGVEVAALEREFGSQLVVPARETARHLAKDGLVTFDGESVRLTARGRLISNEVFQEFLQLDAASLSGRV